MAISYGCEQVAFFRALHHSQPLRNTRMRYKKTIPELPLKGQYYGAPEAAVEVSLPIDPHAGAGPEVWNSDPWIPPHSEENDNEVTQEVGSDFTGKTHATTSDAPAILRSGPAILCPPAPPRIGETSDAWYGMAVRVTPQLIECDVYRAPSRRQGGRRIVPSPLTIRVHERAFNAWTRH